MDGAHTIGHEAAVGAIHRMIVGIAPHAILVSGPVGVGKTTLALDLAAGLLCTAEPRAIRPCRICRSCRLVASGNHPDIHRLAPAGAGGQIRIGDRSDPEPGTVRALIRELALLPVEGGVRVAIVEAAERMNDDAQSALLKTLEEPPSGTVIVLCAADEERLLETVRSRCVRLRLGPVGSRDIEAFLGDRGIADAPAAAHLARIAAGRPGVALTYALAPDATIIRAELARSLLDLLGAGVAQRLVMARDLVLRSADLARALTAGADAAPGSAEKVTSATAVRGRGRAPKRSPSASATGEVQASGAASEEGPDPSVPAEEGAAPRASATERRRAVAQLFEIWRDLARDLAVIEVGDARSLRDPSLADDLSVAHRLLPAADAAAFIERLLIAGELLDGNVAPELLVDDLVVRWRRRAAA